jgi:hypothetical protein
VTTAAGPHTNVWGSPDKRDKKKGGDDPYYFGLSARYQKQRICNKKKAFLSS